MSEGVQPTAISATSGSHQQPAAPMRASGSSPQQVDFNSNRASTCYANFARVTGTPEELIIDAGLNSQSVGQTSQTVHTDLRVVLSLLTAKRLMAALETAVHRHEHAFGMLELDIQQRAHSHGHNIQ